MYSSVLRCAKVLTVLVLIMVFTKICSPVPAMMDKGEFL